MAKLMTKKRNAILDILRDSEKPLSAEMIYEITKDKLQMNLSTIYRAMELFLKEKLINFSTLDKTQYYYISKNEHAHYMICMNCHSMYEVDCKILQLIDDSIDQNEFVVKNHDLTIYGLCKNCK